MVEVEPHVSPVLLVKLPLQQTIHASHVRRLEQMLTVRLVDMIQTAFLNASNALVHLC